MFEDHTYYYMIEINLSMTEKQKLESGLWKGTLYPLQALPACEAKSHGGYSAFPFDNYCGEKPKSMSFVA